MESALYQNPPDGLDAPVGIIETLGFKPEAGFIRLGLHLDRAENTAALLGYDFERAQILQAMGEAVDDVEPDSFLRVRVEIAPDGMPKITTAVVDDTPTLWRIVIASEPLDSQNPWLAVKTTNRQHYDHDRAHLPNGIHEMIYTNEKGQITEGTITNVFCEMNGTVITPPQSAGLLPGVLRQELLATGKAETGDLSVEDLKNAQKIWAGNSLRGLIACKL